MLKRLDKAPFPYCGGKSKAAQAVWQALGDVHHYVEPFAGSLAALLLRPHTCNRPYHSETVNDLDGLLVNFWRSVQLSPEATVEAASWPVSEADLHARHSALLRWRNEQQLEHLMGDPAWHDPVMAGWWVWGACAWIGPGWCNSNGPWIVGADGRLRKRAKRTDEGVNRKLPHIGDNGMGVNRPGTREEGVCRGIPNLHDNGRGVNHAGTREEGVSRGIPHLHDNGMGVNRPGTREEGVKRSIPHLTSNGMGVHHAGTREEGIGEEPYHPVTMPELLRWFQFLSARLRHVRIVNGSWRRVCTHGAMKTLSVRNGKGFCGVFLDPPYSSAKGVDVSSIYRHADNDISEQVNAWCLEHGKKYPWLRIVLAGFEDEHPNLEAEGWRAVRWYKTAHLTGGYANIGGTGNTRQHKECLWLSPYCLDHPQQDLWTL